MGFSPSFNKNRFILAMFAVLAAPTNHSLGDVVYKKVTTLRVVDEAEEQTAEELPKPLSKPEDGPLYRVLKIQTDTTGIKVLIDGGHDKGLLPGTVLKAQRPHVSPAGVLEQIPTALLKTIEVRETYTLAEIVTNGSLDSQLQFGEYPELMIGDTAVPEEINIAPRTQLLPTVSLAYNKLFADPKSNPANYELTNEGRQLLLDQAEVFAKVRAPMLLIEAYTDGQGDRATNQMESYQRALTIRQTLIDEMGFDPDRVVAIGMGEAEASQDSVDQSSNDEPRHVLIKVKTLPKAP